MSWGQAVRTDVPVEAASLVGTYFLYVLVMYFNEGMMNALDKCTGGGAKAVSTSEFDGKDGDEDEDEVGPISKAIAAPLNVFFEASIPDCTKEETKKVRLIA